MSTRVLARMSDPSVSRKQFMLGGFAVLGLGFIAKSVLAQFRRRDDPGGENWYEVVQDMRRPEVWHINLFSGPVRGDLHKAVLVRRWSEQTKGPSAIKRGLEYPWRVQHHDGPQEQSF